MRSFSDGVADLLGVPELAPLRAHGGPSDAATRSFGPNTDAHAAVIRPETSFETASMDLGWYAGVPYAVAQGSNSSNAMCLIILDATPAGPKIGSAR